MEFFSLTPSEGFQILNHAPQFMEAFPYAALYETRWRDDFGNYRSLFALGSNWDPEPWKNPPLSSFWLGFLRYEAIQQWEPTVTFLLPTQFDFPLSAFFEAQWLLIHTNQGNFLSSHPFPQWKKLLQQTDPPHLKLTHPVPVHIQVSREHYIHTLGQIKEEISQGNYYEVNYTVPFHGEGNINPYLVYKNLKQLSPMPFCFLFKWNDHYAIGASPERFFQKQNLLLRSQPIKGTIPRITSPDLDKKQKHILRSHIKYKAENVMIVDLVRNDLHRVCLPHKVWVTRLFEVQSFPFLHHLVSTIEGEIDKETPFSSIIQALFPPGSMTGAPKLAAIQAIERHESVARELYSGTLGYLAPNRNADFCVVIRTLVYSREKAFCSYHTGGAITWDSNPEEEWNELLLKGKALQKVLASI